MSPEVSRCLPFRIPELPTANHNPSNMSKLLTPIDFTNFICYNIITGYGRHDGDSLAVVKRVKRYGRACVTASPIPYRYPVPAGFA